MYIFALCVFEYGYSGHFYQRNDEYGNTSFFDLYGNTLDLIPPYGYFIMESDIIPPWI